MRMVKYIIKKIIYGTVRFFIWVYHRTQCFKLIEIIKEEDRRFQMGKLFNEFASIGKNTNIPTPHRILNPQYMFIGDNFSTLYNFRIEAWDDFRGKPHSPKITIDDNVAFNTDCHIACIDEIKIGNNVLAGSRVYITDHFHGYTDGSDINIPPTFRALTSKGSVNIGDNVLIGEGAAIMPGVTVGKNCIIGANAVVTRSMPANCIVAGVPAKVIRRL